MVTIKLLTTKIKFLLGYINPEGCLADQDQAFLKNECTLYLSAAEED